MNTKNKKCFEIKYKSMLTGKVKTVKVSGVSKREAFEKYWKKHPANDIISFTATPCKENIK